MLPSLHGPSYPASLLHLAYIIASEVSWTWLPLLGTGNSNSLWSPTSLPVSDLVPCDLAFWYGRCAPGFHRIEVPSFLRQSHDQTFAVSVDVKEILLFRTAHVRGQELGPTFFGRFSPLARGWLTPFKIEKWAFAVTQNQHEGKSARHSESINYFVA
jgi:hypothetical protein